MNGNTNGVADPIQSLSPFDVLGTQEIYGAKADGSIVGLGGRCIRATRNGGLKYFDCSADGSTVFPVSWEKDPNAIPPTVAMYYRRFQNTYGANQCWTTSGNSVSGRACQSPLPTNQQFYMTAARLRAMGNMCVVATDTVPGSTLKLQPCGVVSSLLERWEWSGNSLNLTGTNLCVTVPPSPGAGSLPTLEECIGGQTTNPSILDKWNRQNLAWGAKKIKFGRLCLNVFGGWPTPDSDVGLWVDNDYSNSQFYLTGQIRAVSNQKCIDLSHSQTANGTNVSLYSCGDVGQPNQEWDYHF